MHYCLFRFYRCPQWHLYYAFDLFIFISFIRLVNTIFWCVELHLVWFVVHVKLKKRCWSTLELNGMVCITFMILHPVNKACYFLVGYHQLCLLSLSFSCFLCNIVNIFVAFAEVTSDGLFSVGEMECMVMWSTYLWDAISVAFRLCP